jgi:ATP-dependent Clp protease adaptor protein ClpS
MENPRLPKRMQQTKTHVQHAETDVEVVIRARCILYNDDYHTFDEVIEQLMIAIRCSARRAEDMAWQVHNHGNCVVHVGAIEDCLEISAVLGEIDLRTEVQL